MQIAMQEYIAC